MANDLLFMRPRVPLGYDDTDETDDSMPSTSAIPSGRPAPITAMAPTAAPPKTPIGSASVAQPSKLDTDKTELQRLQNSRSGLSQMTRPVDAQGNPTGQHVGIGHKIGAVLGRIGDIAGTALFPSITAQIPGTELHHQVLTNQAANRVNNDLATEQKEATIQATNLKPQLDQAKLENTQQAATDKLNAQLAQHGFKRDANGSIIPLPYEEMSQDQQAVHDLRASQQEVADATAALKKAQKDNIPLATQMAQQRLQTAQHNAAIAAGRLGLSKDEFERDTFGTFHGEPIPGAPTDNEGHTIGTKVAPKNPGLTNSTRTMVEAAPKVRNFVTRINQLIDEQKKSLGPASSRWSEYMAGKIGAPNPEFTKLRTDVGLLQTLLMRMHVGSRGGEYIMKHFQDLIDSGKQSPENLKAALEEIDNYAQQVEAEGQAPQPAPAAHTNSGPKAGDVVDGFKFKGGDPSNQSNWEKVSK